MKNKINKAASRQVQWPAWRIAIACLSSLALILSVMLSWHFLKGGAMIGCDGGSPCQQVLNSKWSVIAGVLPISGLAAGIYLALLFAVFFSVPGEDLQVRKLAWRSMIVLSGAIIGSALWFTILQKWFIGSFCPYCMTTHITGVILSLMIIVRATREPDFESPQKKLFLKSRHIAFLALAGLTLSVMLAIMQVISTPESAFDEGESQNMLPELDYENVPLVGFSYAPYKINVLFDFQCPHCQELHFMLEDVIKKYEGKVAFALCPAPLDSDCNPYVSGTNEAFRNSCELARIALAIWIADPSSFRQFGEWMFTYETGDRWNPRSPEAATAKAIEIVGAESFSKAFKDPWIEMYISKSIQMYGQTIQNGRGGIPKMISGSRWVIPQASNADELIKILQNTLELPEL